MSKKCRCENSTTCNKELLRLYLRYKKLLKRYRKRFGNKKCRTYTNIWENCVPCCQSGLIQQKDAAGTSNNFYPYALIDSVNIKPGTRRKICCCLRKGIRQMNTELKAKLWNWTPILKDGVYNKGAGDGVGPVEWTVKRIGCNKSRKYIFYTSTTSHEVIFQYDAKKQTYYAESPAGSDQLRFAVKPKTTYKFIYTYTYSGIDVSKSTVYNLN